MRHRPVVVVPAALCVALLAGCGGSGGSATTSTATTGASTATASASTTTSASGATSPSAATSGTVPTTGPALAGAIESAATGQYTVRTTLTGDIPLDVSGRGDLRAGTLAVRVAPTADAAAQDVELVGGTAYTTLDDATTGRQRIAVRLADPDDQLVDAVLPVVAVTDLRRVVTAVRAATSVTRSGDTVTALVPSRALVGLFGAALDGSVPATAPVRLVLDAQGRVQKVTARLGTAERTSTYGGWTPGAAITAPAKVDIVDSPL